MVNVAGMRHFRLATVCPIKRSVGMHRAIFFSNRVHPSRPLDLSPISDSKRFWKLNHDAMKLLLQEIRRNPLLWLLVFVPIALAAEKLNHEAHTLHFVLSVLAILPLAVLLSHATESVAAKTGDSVGGLLNATLGNLTELVIAIAALQAGQYTLVKASVAGAIVTNSLFMLGACVPARRTPLSCSGIQPCRRAISGRLAFSRYNSASDPVRGGRA